MLPFILEYFKFNGKKFKTAIKNFFFTIFVSLLFLYIFYYDFLFIYSKYIFSFFYITFIDPSTVFFKALILTHDFIMSLLIIVIVLIT